MNENKTHPIATDIDIELEESTETEESTELTLLPESASPTSGGTFW